MEQDELISINNHLGATLESAEYAASHDSLTGLQNLSSFFSRCEAVKKQRAGEGKPCALLYFDLNGMKY